MSVEWNDMQSAQPMTVAGPAELPRSLRPSFDAPEETPQSTPTRHHWTSYEDSAAGHYESLCDVAERLDALDSCRDVVADLVQSLAWSDGVLNRGEESTLNRLIRADRERNGDLAARLHQAGTLRTEHLPPFLERCQRHDMAHGTRTFGTVVNALESIGYCLLASDRVIHPDEMAALRTQIRVWRDQARAMAPVTLL